MYQLRFRMIYKYYCVLIYRKFYLHWNLIFLISATRCCGVRSNWTSLPLRWKDLERQWRCHVSYLVLEWQASLFTGYVRGQAELWSGLGGWIQVQTLLALRSIPLCHIWRRKTPAPSFFSLTTTQHLTPSFHNDCWTSWGGWMWTLHLDPHLPVRGSELTATHQKPSCLFVLLQVLCWINSVYFGWCID